MANNGNNINFKLNFQMGDAKAFNELKAKFNEVRELASDMGNIGLDTKQMQSTLNAVNVLEQALNRAYDPTLNTINIQKFNQLLLQSGMDANKLQTELSAVGFTGQQAFLKATSQLMQFNTATKQTNKFLDNIATTLFNTIKWTATSSIINNISGSIQKSYYYVKDLDSSLNDIRIVTNKSAEDMAEFAVQANNAAKALAVTTEDYTQGALIYYQQGLDDETVKALTDVTAMTSNVTGQSMNTVSEQLTAVQNGYQVANEAAKEGMQVYQEYVDKMAAVGATTASDLEELSTAMSKVASAASSMGVDFDDLNAQIATIVSVTRQAPESVGTALKTIYARLGDLKVDGVDEFGTKLGEVSGQLKTMGIDIIDQAGNMRNMSDVIAEVAEKQNLWTDAQRQAAAIAMAGKRQYNNLIALFDNQDMYGEALETSMNAAGTLEKQQEIAMESLKNKMDVLKATAEDLYDSLFDTDTIGGFIDAGTGVLKFFTEFADSVGGLNNILPLLTFNLTQLFSGQIANGIGTLVNNMRIASDQEKIMAQNAEQLKLMFSDSSLVQAMGSQGAGGIAAVQSFNELKQYYNDMQQYQQLMTKEEKEQYNIVLQNLEKLGEKKVLLAELTESYKGHTKALELIDENLIKDVSRVGELTTQTKALSEFADQLLGAITNSKGDLIDREDIEQAENLREIIDKLGGTFDLTNINVEKLSKLFENLKRDTDSTVETLSKLGQAVAKVGASGSEIAGLTNEIDNQASAIRNVSDAMSQSLNTEAIIQKGVQIASGIGQIAMAIQTIKNLGSIQENDDLTTAEKQLQTITNISFVLPGVIGSLTSIGKLLGVTTGIIGTLQAKQKLSATLSGISAAGYTLEAKAIKGKTEAQIKDLLIEQYLEKQIIKSNGQRITSIAELSAEQKQILSDVVAKELDTGATEKLTIAQKALNGSILTNPQVIAIAAITTLISVYAILKSKQEEQLKKLREIREEEIQNIKQQQEEIEENKKLLENQDKLYKEYDKTKEKKQELREQSLELINTYDIENGYLLVQTENYKELAKAAEEAKNKKLELEKVNAKDIIDKTVTNIVSKEEKEGIIASNGKMYTSFSSHGDKLYKNSYEDLIKISDTVRTGGFSNEEGIEFSFDPNDSKEVYQYLQDINKQIEFLEIRYTKAELAGSSYYKNLKEKQSEYSDELEELEKQFDVIYSNTTEIAASTVDFSNLYDKNNNIKFEELNKIIQNLRNTLSEDIPEDKVDKYINNVLTKVKNIEPAALDVFDAIEKYADKKITNKNVTNVADSSPFVQDKNENKKILKEDIKKTLKEKYFDEIDKLNKSDQNQIALHINTKPLDMELQEQLDAHQKERVYQEKNENSSSLKIALSNFDKDKGFSDTTVDSLYANENISQVIGQTKEEFNVSDKATQLHELTRAQIDQTKASQEARDAAAEAINKELEAAEAQYKRHENSFDESENIKRQTDNVEQLKGKSEELMKIFDKLGHGFDVTELESSEQSLLENAKQLLNQDQKYIDNVSKKTAQLNDEREIYESLKDELDAVSDASYSQQKAEELLTQDVSNLNKELDSIQSTYKELNNIVDAYNETGHQTVDNVQKLMELSDSYVATLDMEGNAVSLNEQAYQALAAAKITELEQTAYEIYMKELDRIATLEETEASAEAAVVAIYTGDSFETMGEKAQAAANYLLDTAEKARLAKNLMTEDQNLIADQAEKAFKNRMKALEDARNEIFKGGASMRKAMGAEKKEKKSGGSKKDKDKDKKEQEDEFDRYQEIKKVIEAVDNALKKLDKDKQNLYGYELIDALKKENDLLEQQAANYNRLYEMQQQEAAELREQLGTMGLMFDASGAITNYAAATSAALAQYSAAIEQYNAGLIDETTLGVYEKAYNNFKKLLERYDKLYYTEMQNTQDKLDELRRKELANNLKAQEVEIQIHLDKEKMKRDQNDFLKDIEQDFKKVFPDLTIDVKFDKKNFDSLVNDVNTTIKAIKEVEAEIDKMMNGGTSDMFESISQAQEKLKELQEKLLEQGKSLREIYKQVQDTYLKGLDQVKEKFEELMKRYERFNNELEYHRQLIELLYGDKAYDLMDKYYEAQTENIDAQISSLRQQADFWQNEFNKSFESAIAQGSDVDINDYTTWTEDMKKAYENMVDSQEKLNDLVLEGVKVLQDQYLNTINKIMDAMDKGIWGSGGFQGMKDNQEFMQKMAEEYLDDVEGASAIQLFANRMDMDKANATTLKAQQKIQDFREKEIKALREKENLTQADIDLAEARYQLMLKEIALEDAQNNKTSMKLTRNEQGNQTYQYVADEDDVAQKEQDLLQSYADLYKLADDSYQHSMELAMDLYEEMYNKIQQIASDVTLTEEEKQQKIQEIQDMYLPQIEAAAANSELYKQEAMIASAGVFATVCEQDATAYETLTDYQKELVDSLRDKNFEDYDAMREAIINGYYPDLRDIATEVFNETNINSQTIAAQAIGTQAKNPDSVKNIVIKAISDIKQATIDYEEELKKLQEIAGVNFNNIAGYIDNVVGKIHDMDGATGNLADNSSKYLDELRKWLETIADNQDSVIKKIQDAHNAMQDYLDLKRQADAGGGSNSGGSGGGNSGGPGGGGNPGDGGDPSNPGGPGGKDDPNNPNDKYYVSSIQTDDNRGYGPYRVMVRSTSGKEKSVFTSYDYNDFMNRKEDILRGQTIGTPISFGSGGYTGIQNNGDNSGQQAMLHQKEIVLNKDDTENLLESVSLIRDMTAINGSISDAIASAVINTILSLSKGLDNRFDPIGMANPEYSESGGNVFNITAEFPNANNADEIREAILSLPNYASQYSGKRKRQEERVF